MNRVLVSQAARALLLGSAALYGRIQAPAEAEACNYCAADCQYSFCSYVSHGYNNCHIPTVGTCVFDYVYCCDTPSCPA